MTDQPVYVTREEFERRMGELRSEIEGEKRVTRHVLEQARLNSDDLGSMKAQLSHVEYDMVLVKTALDSHGNRLNVLTQDVREMRNEMGQMRTEMGQIRTEMGQMGTKLDKLDLLAQDVAAIRAALAPRDPRAE